MSAAGTRSRSVARAHFLVESAPRVSVIVVGWREAPYLLDCLAALARSAPRTPYEVLVVLNEPTAALAGAVARDLVGARVLAIEANLGFGGAVNLAARHARGAFLALLNDDAEVEPGWLDGLVDAATRRPEAAAIGGLVAFPDGRLQEAGSVLWADGWTSGVGRDLAAEDGRWHFERRVDYCSASSLLVRTSAFLAVGGFDEDYYPAYFEDVDLCLRLAQMAGPTWFTPLARVRHRESQSTNTTYRQFLMERNHARFAERWRDALARRCPRENSPAGIDKAVRLASGARGHLLVIDDRTPDPAFGSGLGRMADVLRELVEDGGYLVTFFPGSEEGARDPDRMARARVELVRNDLVAYRGRLAEAIDDHLASRASRYDGVIISRPHNWERYGEALRARLPDAPLLYDAEAVYSRRIARQRALAGDLVSRLELGVELEQMQALERAIAAEADAIVCICGEEADVFRRLGAASVSVNPPQLAAAQPTPANLAQRADLAFVAGWGAGAESPNADGLVWFVRSVLGRVRARVPGTRLLVSGAAPPRNVERLAGPGVELLGAVADLRALYRAARVVVVPIRHGAGVKLKTIEALQHAVPVVSTSVGAEGIPLADPSAVCVADDPAAFADALVTLLTDDEAWQAQRRAIVAEEAAWSERDAPRVWRALVESVLAAASAKRPVCPGPADLDCYARRP